MVGCREAAAAWPRACHIYFLLYRPAAVYARAAHAGGRLCDSSQSTRLGVGLAAAAGRLMSAAALQAAPPRRQLPPAGSVPSRTAPAPLARRALPPGPLPRWGGCRGRGAAPPHAPPPPRPARAAFDHGFDDCCSFHQATDVFWGGRERSGYGRVSGGGSILCETSHCWCGEAGLTTSARENYDPRLFRGRRPPARSTAAAAAAFVTTPHAAG